LTASPNEFYYGRSLRPFGPYGNIVYDDGLSRTVGAASFNNSAEYWADAAALYAVGTSNEGFDMENPIERLRQSIVQNTITDVIDSVYDLP
jgi:hypothetical protein